MAELFMISKTRMFVLANATDFSVCKVKNPSAQTDRKKSLLSGFLLRLLSKHCFRVSFRTWAQAGRDRGTMTLAGSAPNLTSWSAFPSFWYRFFAWKALLPARFVPQAAWTPGSLLVQSHKHQWHKQSPLSKSIWPKWRDTEILANLWRTGTSVFACDRAPNVSVLKHSTPVCRKGAHSKSLKMRLFI